MLNWMLCMQTWQPETDGNAGVSCMHFTMLMGTAVGAVLPPAEGEEGAGGGGDNRAICC